MPDDRPIWRMKDRQIAAHGELYQVYGLPLINLQASWARWVAGSAESYDYLYKDNE